MQQKTFIEKLSSDQEKVSMSCLLSSMLAGLCLF